MGAMEPLHAFGDDALGELDAVGLVEALHAGRVSVPEVDRGRHRPDQRRSTRR